MVRQIRELQEISDRACFVNPNALYGCFDLDWLKTYLLLYDVIVLDSRSGFGPQGFQLRKTWYIWRWLEKNAVFLEDFDGEATLPRDDYTALPALSEHGGWPIRLPPATRSVMFTKENQLNKAFLRTFEEKVKSRRGGATDWNEAFQAWKFSFKDHAIIEKDGSIGGVSVSLFYNEIYGAWRSFQVSLIGGPPSVQDALSGWLTRKIYRVPLNENSNGARFREILIRNIPDFTQLSWESIIELRESAHRKDCLNYLRGFPHKSAADIQDDLQASFWNLASDAQRSSSLPKTVLKGVAGNLPVPIINPIGLTMSLEDIYRAWDSQKRYGWVYYLAEIRRHTENHA